MRDFSAVKIDVIAVRGSVYMLKGAGGNIGVCAGEDGVILVDTQYAELAPKIAAALKTIVDRPVRFVINTHHHHDHVGGNEFFSREAAIVAHEHCARRLDPPPAMSFNRSMTLRHNGEDVHARHFPDGHTDGDAVVFFTKANVVHMGDDFFNGRFPFIDLKSGGSVNGYIAAVKEILTMTPDDVKIIPGHGPLTDKTALCGFLDMLEATSNIVARAIEAGKTLEQLKVENVLAPWENWSWDFVPAGKFLETLGARPSRPQ